MIIRVSRIDRLGRQLDRHEAAKRIGRTVRYRGMKPGYFLFETRAPSFCAICGVVAQGIGLQQLDVGGPLIAVCDRCENEHPNQGGYTSTVATRAGSRPVCG